MPDKIVYDGKWIRVIDRDGWEFMTRPNVNKVVFVLPVTDSGDYVLIEQYRAPSDRFVIEICAGLVGDEGDETPEEAGRRELVEECGYMAGKMHHLCDGPISQGSSDIHSYFFAATEIIPVEGAGGGTADEKIKIYHVSPSDIDYFLGQMASAGRLIDPKIYVALRQYESGKFQEEIWKRQDANNTMELMWLVAENIFKLDRVGIMNDHVVYTDYDMGGTFNFDIDVERWLWLLRECDLEMSSSEMDDKQMWTCKTKDGKFEACYPNPNNALCIAALLSRGWKGMYRGRPG